MPSTKRSKSLPPPALRPQDDVSNGAFRTREEQLVEELRSVRAELDRTKSELETMRTVSVEAQRGMQRQIAATQSANDRFDQLSELLDRRVDLHIGDFDMLTQALERRDTIMQAMQEQHRVEVQAWRELHRVEGQRRRDLIDRLRNLLER